MSYRLPDNIGYSIQIMGIALNMNYGVAVISIVWCRWKLSSRGLIMADTVSVPLETETKLRKRKFNLYSSVATVFWKCNILQVPSFAYNYILPLGTIVNDKP